MKKRLAVLVLAFAMVLTMSVSVFAKEGESTTTHDNSGGFYITKTLNIGEGITVPDETFTFTFAKGDDSYASDAGYVDPSTTTYPTLDDVSISFSSADRAADGTDEAITKVSSKIVIDPTQFPKSGMYVYKVTEEEPASPTANMTYDKTHEYFVKIYIQNSTTGTKTLADVEISDGTNKIDATSGEGKEEPTVTDGADDVQGNGFVFTNTFTKIIENDPDNNNVAFQLSKTLAGNYSGADDVFTFTVNIALPSTVNSFTFTKAGTATVTSNGGTLAVGDNTVTMKGGQAFQIEKLPAGTKITVSEAAFENYTPSVAVKHSANEAKTAAAEYSKNGELETALKAEQDGKKVVVGDFGADVAYTNTFDSVTPTGIIINNLPYVLLIGIALGGIVLFSRKRRYE